jgi:hypothetical protein
VLTRDETTKETQERWNVLVLCLANTHPPTPVRSVAYIDRTRRAHTSPALGLGGHPTAASRVFS